jgi:GDPmannose 4,6-dehydratase
MWLILQQEEPEDFVIATGITTTVRDFVKMAFAEIGIELAFSGSDGEEFGEVVHCNNPDFHVQKGKKIVVVDPKYFRPTEVDLLIGDASKANKKLGWRPKYDLAGLVHEMVQADLEHFRKEKLLKESGFEIRNQHE